MEEILSHTTTPDVSSPTILRVTLIIIKMSHQFRGSYPPEVVNFQPALFRVPSSYLYNNVAPVSHRIFLLYSFTLSHRPQYPATQGSQADGRLCQPTRLAPTVAARSPL